MFPNRFVADHVQNFFQAPVEAGRLVGGEPVPTNRIMVWEWPQFTRSDLRAHYRFRGHFRSILKILDRRSWTNDLKPHFDSFAGMIALREGELGRAEAAMAEALATRPDVAIFHKRLAELRHEQGRASEARAAIDEAVGLAPQVSMLRAMRGHLQLQQGDPAGAAAELLALLAEGQLMFPSVFFLASDAAQAADRKAEAVAALERGLALAPMNWRRQHDLARLKAEAGDRAGAQPVLEWTLQWADDHPPLVMLNTDLLVEAGRTGDARDHLERLMARYPDKMQYARRHKKLDKAPPIPRRATGAI